MIRRHCRLGVVIWVILTLQGCAAQRTARIPPDAAQSRLEIGDRVVVALNNGKKYRAVVAAMTDTALVSQKSLYPWQEIRYIALDGRDEHQSPLAKFGMGVLGSAALGLLFVLVV